jgi:topoisomerase-4 subunit A
MLEDCKSQCEILIVGLQTDPTLDRKSKNKPVQEFEERNIMIRSIKYVDEVIKYETEEDLLECHQDMLVLEKWNPKKPISVIYFDGTKKSHYVKRFLVENIEGKYSFIGDNKDSVLELLSTDWRPVAELVFVKQKGKDRKEEQLNIEEFITIKGWKALGNKLTNKKIKEIKLLNSLAYKEVQEEICEQIIEVLEDVSQEVTEIETEDSAIIQKIEVEKITEKVVDVKEDSSDNKPNISDEGPHQITLDL